MRTWDSGEAKSWSAEHGSKAQYNPHRFGTDEAVRNLELRCVDHGHQIDSTISKRTYYLHAGAGVIVGVCSGVETEFVFVEWSAGAGGIHGRPISVDLLVAKLKKEGLELVRSDQ